MPRLPRRVPLLVLDDLSGGLMPVVFPEEIPTLARPATVAGIGRGLVAPAAGGRGEALRRAMRAEAPSAATVSVRRLVPPVAALAVPHARLVG
jgi:hypothetical protein